LRREEKKRKAPGKITSASLTHQLKLYPKDHLLLGRNADREIINPAGKKADREVFAIDQGDWSGRLAWAGNEKQSFALLPDDS
jgi:hypothetical protein